MSVSSVCAKPIEDTFVVVDRDTPKGMEELKSENLHLRIENSTLMHNIMEQQKEIMRLQQVILDQNKEFHEALTRLTIRQITLEEKIKSSEDKSKIAIASTAIALACAVIGGTCGFSGAYRIAARVVASLVATETVVSNSCEILMVKV